VSAVMVNIQVFHCTKTQARFPRAHDHRNFISWRWSPPTATDPVWWISLHAISSYRGNRPTNKHTNRQDWLQYSALL